MTTFPTGDGRSKSIALIRKLNLTESIFQEVLMEQEPGTMIDNHTNANDLRALGRCYFHYNNVLQLLGFFCPSAAILLVSGHRISSAVTGNVLSNRVLYAAVELSL